MLFQELLPVEIWKTIFLDLVEFRDFKIRPKNQLINKEISLQVLCCVSKSCSKIIPEIVLFYFEDFGRPKFSNWVLHHFTHIEILDLSRNEIIEDQTLMCLTNLTQLNLSYNKKITNQGLLKLSKLKSLNIERNELISDEAIMHMTSLTNLRVNENEKITDKAIINSSYYLREFVYSEG